MPRLSLTMREEILKTSNVLLQRSTRGCIAMRGAALVAREIVLGVISVQPADVESVSAARRMIMWTGGRHHGDVLIRQSSAGAAAVDREMAAATWRASCDVHGGRCCTAKRSTMSSERRKSFVL